MSNLTRVVRIGTGEQEEAVVTDWGAVWKIESLKKDGSPPLNRILDGRMAAGEGVYLGSYATFDPQREEQAQLIRVRIAALRSQVEEAEKELLALY